MLTSEAHVQESIFLADYIAGNNVHNLAENFHRFSGLRNWHKKHIMLLNIIGTYNQLILVEPEW